MNDRTIHQQLPVSAPADSDPQESAEWRDAFRAVLQAAGPARARELMDMLSALARDPSVAWQPVRGTPYVNTIPAAQQPAFPGDLAIEERLASLMRWNALAMVVRANQAHGELGGHIASYASAADLFEVGFNHFFRAGADAAGGDLVFYQPHSAPGVYARAFLEGRLSEADLGSYRQEISAAERGARGLSSYPHPYLMPDFWQFPTGSMGIGPISSIYHARFMRYLEHRGLLPASDRRVWGFFGDGEMDEPESMSALTLASRANRPSQSEPQTSLMTRQPAPANNASSSSMMRPLPRTGPSRRCRLQLTTQIRLSSCSRAASVSALMLSGSSISPSPNTPQTRRWSTRSPDALRLAVSCTPRCCR